MESIKNVAVSDLVPSFLLLNLSSVTKFSCMFEKFSCARRMYHFTSYQVGDFSVPSGNFRVCNIHTIFTSYHVWGFPVPSGNCVRHTYHFISYQVGEFLVPSGNFRERDDVCTISSTTKWGTFWFVQEIFVHATYILCSTDNTGTRSGSPQLLHKPDEVCFTLIPSPNSPDKVPKYLTSSLPAYIQSQLSGLMRQN